MQTRDDVTVHSLVQGHKCNGSKAVPLHFRRVEPSVVAMAIVNTRFLSFVKVSVLDWISRGYKSIAWLPWQGTTFRGGFVFRGGDNVTTAAVFEVVEAPEMKATRPSAYELSSGSNIQWHYCFGVEGWRRFNAPNSQV